MVQIAILGFGVVGSDVAEILIQNRANIARSADEEIGLKYILDLHDLPESPFRDKLATDFETILADPEIQVVVETIGGVGAAYDYTKRALQAGKSVATSNKELIATRGCELLAIAKETNANYLFEASVGGGIPVIRPITQCLAANQLDAVYGIVNGTTNYLLSQMSAGTKSFAEALSEAQAKGYAEADPVADLDGTDACRKICILASLSFGRHILPHQVETEGITQVTAADIAWAKDMGCKIKLVARALRVTDGKIAAYVAPHLVRDDHILAHVEDVHNAILVQGNAIGEVMFYGPGAGGRPTASAVVADVIDCVKHLKARKYLLWARGGPEIAADPGELKTPWYVRTEAGASIHPAAMSRPELAEKLKSSGAYCAFRVLD